MKIARVTLVAVVLMFGAMTQAWAGVLLTDDLSTKTGWTAVEGGDVGYTAGIDFLGNRTGHYLSGTATSQRQKQLDTPANYSAGFTLTLEYDVMLHNSMAAVNEPVARVGLLPDGSVAPAAGRLAQVWLTIRRVGTIQIQALAYTNSAGDTEEILSGSGSVGGTYGLNGYEYADWTVTRDASGAWTVDALNAYGEHAVNFTATESTVATSSALGRVYVQDLYPNSNWNGSEAAVYWDSIAVSGTGNPIPEPATIGLISLGGLLTVAKKARK